MFGVTPTHGGQPKNDYNSVIFKDTELNFDLIAESRSDHYWAPIHVTGYYKIALSFTRFN